MTLLDAPAFDAARDRRIRITLYTCASLFVVLLVGGWFASGMPVDWPWNWWTHMRGRMVTNSFFTAVEHNDLSKAYGVWTHDPAWQQHPALHSAYPFDKFQQDWGPTSPQNEYGPIKSHKILATRISGNVLILAIQINGLKSTNAFLVYDPHDHTLGFSPVQLYLGP
ncbi:MAG TPA: hypothetical protein VMV57_09205 [Terracidiphilus sp.]|nr:hypothetical protein [Terracidiphilus sp.]